MLNEYAVDPACLGDWQNFRYLMGAFGVSQGRIISQFPKDWVKRVCESCGSFSFKQRQKMEIELLRIKKHALTRSGRNYDGGKAWLENATLQHDIKPFKAVITKESTQEAVYFIPVEDIAPHTTLWAVERELKVPRTVDALADAIAPLLRISNRILFIDKMFHPAADRWREVLARMLKVAYNDQERPPSYEYHCGIEPEEFGKPEEQRKSDFRKECERYLLDILPSRSALSITRWDRHHKGDFFHDRYVLTEKGGVRVGWGLDRGKPGETTDISLLDDVIYSQLWSAFQPDNNLYRLIDTTTITQ